MQELRRYSDYILTVENLEEDLQKSVLSKKILSKVSTFIPEDRNKIIEALHVFLYNTIYDERKINICMNLFDCMDFLCLKRYCMSHFLKVVELDFDKPYIEDLLKILYS